MVGGGTGGHIYPAIAIAEAIQEVDIDSQILFVGSDDGIETRIIPKERFSLATIRARRMLRIISFRSLMAPFYAVLAFIDSIKVLNNFKPDAIVATGGFVSLPVVFAGVFKRVPVLLHEGNVTPGLSTRICKWFAKRITVAFESSRRYYRFRRVYCTGGPVRRQIIKAVRGISIQNMGMKQDNKYLLVLGGSQGARSINNLIIELLPDLSGLNVQIIHICGERNYDSIKDSAGQSYTNYHLIPYMYNIWDGLAAADLVISRAGATAISEILARGIPSILIPFPYSSECHQDHNADILKNSGAAIVINEKDLTKERLRDEIILILNDKELQQKMKESCKPLVRQDSAKQVVEIMFQMLGIDIYARKRKKTKKQTA